MDINDTDLINIKTSWIENIKIELELDSETDINCIITLEVIFDVIHDYIKDLHVFTINSILRGITHVVDMHEDIENLSIEFLRLCVTSYINIISMNMSIESKISSDELATVYNELIVNSVSLRQLFSTNYGLMETIDINSALEIFHLANLDSLVELYGRINDSTQIDLINDVFRPIESVVDELPMCVVIPSFNNILTLLITAESIYCQNYSNYRVIFIDDLSDDPLELETVLNISKNFNQDSRYLIIKQYVKQRQCAGRYIGYHMAYDDEIILFLDGDDMFYNQETMNIINNTYLNYPVAVTYGSHVDLYQDTIHDILKGNKSFPVDIIKNKMYRFHDFLSAHLRTGYAYLFKNIHITDLLHNDGRFFKIMTDYAEMIPVLEMITPDDMNDYINDNNVNNNNNVNNELGEILPYLKVIKEPVYIYNMDNSLNYKTSFARRDDKDNTYYSNYRRDATEYIRSLTKYGFSLKRNRIKTSLYPLMLMKNYHIDALIINCDNDIDKIDNVNSTIIQNFFTDESLYLTGLILNADLNHRFEIGSNIIELNQLCLKAMIIPSGILINEYNTLQKNYYIILNGDVNKQIDKNLLNSDENVNYVVGYLDGFIVM